MRLFISFDMEGVAGVVTEKQLIPSGFEWQQAREWMTNELLAVIEAAEECGVTEFVVADSHGTGQNLLVDRLPKNVELVRSWPRPLHMIQGVEEGPFVGAMLLGYHGGAHTLGAGLAHTAMLHVTSVSLNGLQVSETGIAAATAGQFGVPVIMVSGDDVYVEHARETLGDVEAVTTRTAYSFSSGKVITPARSCELLAERTRIAIGRAAEFKPFKVDFPVRMEVRLSNPVLAEMFCWLPGFERVDAHTIAMKSEDMRGVEGFWGFLGEMLGKRWEALFG